MGRLSSVLLKGVGVLVLALIALSVVGTIVGIALSVIVAVLSVIVSLAVLGVFALVIVGLFSMVSDRPASADEPRAPRRSTEQPDPEDRLRDRYVEGELDDAEFERELERIFDPSERRERAETGRSVTRDAASDRQLRDR
ncbi:hypothetical protein [Natrinema salaciae]|uniref:Short C-terminal domain-containing protein n=1 Tax=Natrinema salaciae TaxID=1186196 RepID=A0A1H9M8K4_9EURY|nr:hypothetical protein [Natrinema salaciae]SER20036.1 hypothetical protein SAMN04489841_3255 [Natrinema salaciae]